MKKVIITSIIIIGVAALIVLRLASNKKEIDSRKEVKITTAAIAVTIAEVGFQSPENVISLVGTTEASREVKVASKSAGEIVQINFKLGDYVSQGTVLARVDDAYTRLALENAAINHNKNKDDLQRYENLRAGDAITEAQMRDAQTAFERTKVQLEQAKRQLEDTYIRAPFGGYITSREIESGKFVGVGTPIASIADISELKVSLSVIESNVYRLRKGKDVNVTTQIYPGVTFTGKIAHISPQGDNAHSYPVEISLPNSVQNPLKAGTYVNVSINAGTTQPVLSIPRDAIVSSIKEPSVYRVEGNIVKLVKIITGKNYENSIEVLQGLKEGDKVVVNGQINLMDGAMIMIIKN